MEKDRTSRKPRLDIDGVLLLDKPAGVSSNDALIQAKRYFNAKKAGHTGTLDPFATGLLPLCFGEATKFSQDLLNADKTYLTIVQLGVCTDTGDTEGKVVSKAQVPELTANAIEQVLDCFRGTIQQVPPMYSALKRDGKPLYEYARQGIELEREAREVIIHELALVEWQPPYLTLSVTCSKGTYIRVLGEDIGKAIGCGAHLRMLRRTRVGALTLEQAVALSVLQETSDAPQTAKSHYLKPVDWLLSDSPSLVLPDGLSGRYRHGQRLSVIKENIPISDSKGRYRIYDVSGVFLGTAQLRADGVLAPERLVALRQF
ncbi:MAG: tRNA pseudouridine(55) synthase TruB [Oxalobacter sp.]